MSLNIAIIEDEPATARNLAYTINEVDGDANILASLSDIKSAVEWLSLNADKCDLLFMDIRLGDGISFDILKKITIKTPVIFVTAYNEYALEAFKANGIHYILKPFSEEDVEEALDKFKNLSHSNAAALPYELLMQALQQAKIMGNYKRSLLVQFRDKLIPLNITDIKFFYSKNEVLFAHTTTNKYMVDGTLEKMLQELDPLQFFRANRQFIININAVQEAHFYFNGRLLIKTQPEAPEQILISKARVPEFKTWMNK